VTRVLITGCSSGIGRATAVELDKRGYEVVATARRPETIDDLDVAVRLPLDVTSDDSVEAAVAAAGEVDILVNNAGMSVVGPVENVPLDRVRAMLETNVLGPARMIQAFLPGMRARNRGAIVNVSSAAGRAVAPLNGYYSATKWALEALSEAVDMELTRWGIKVVVIEPGYVATDMVERSERFGMSGPYKDLAQLSDGYTAELAAHNPQGPGVVAEAIAAALEEEHPTLRHPVGLDAEFVVGARETMSYEKFVTLLRDMLGSNLGRSRSEVRTLRRSADP
jgi:NADP-dependent 3-hydroxy acid dehydrogenase YdfG